MSYLYPVLRTLAACYGEKLPAYRLSARSGVPSKKFQKYAAEMVRDGHISRERVTQGKRGAFWYFLSDSQYKTARLKLALASSDVDDKTMGLVTEAEGLPARLKFLRMLKENTVFGQHAMLAMIIDDYERTLRLRRAIEGRTERSAA